MSKKKKPKGKPKPKTMTMKEFSEWFSANENELSPDQTKQIIEFLRNNTIQKGGGR